MRRAESCASSGAAGDIVADADADADADDESADADADAGCGTAAVARGSTPTGARLCAKATARKASEDAIGSC